jgi:hypothetical protein
MRSHRRSSRAYNHKCFIIIRNLMNTLKFQFDQVGIYICLFFIYQTFRCDQIGIFQLARSRIVLSSFQSWPFLPDGTTDTFYESFIVIASEGCPEKGQDQVIDICRLQYLSVSFAGKNDDLSRLERSYSTIRNNPISTTYYSISITS